MVRRGFFRAAVGSVLAYFGLRETSKPQYTNRRKHILTDRNGEPWGSVESWDGDRGQVWQRGDLPEYTCPRCGDHLIRPKQYSHSFCFGCGFEGVVITREVYFGVSNFGEDHFRTDPAYVYSKEYGTSIVPDEISEVG